MRIVSVIDFACHMRPKVNNLIKTIFCFQRNFKGPKSHHELQVGKDYRNKFVQLTSWFHHLSLNYFPFAVIIGHLPVITAGFKDHCIHGRKMSSNDTLMTLLRGSVIDETWFEMTADTSFSPIFHDQRHWRVVYVRFQHSIYEMVDYVNF